MTCPIEGGCRERTIAVSKENGDIVAPFIRYSQILVPIKVEIPDGT
jgi:hypothetical protein